MLVNESVWIKSVFERFLQKKSTVVNIGAQTKEFLEQQHWIKENVLRTLHYKEVRLVNVDIKDDENVDLVLDITKYENAMLIKELKPDLILCSNVLEHIEERDLFIKSLLSLVGTGKYLLVTVPYKFPYHPDPIDTMFRPTLSELIDMFPTFEVVDSFTTDDGIYLNYLSEGNKYIYFFIRLWFGKFFRLIKALLLFRNGRKLVEMLVDLTSVTPYFKTISVNCVLFLKK